MEKEAQADKPVVEREGWLSGCLMWFFWGSSMSVMGVFSLVLLGLLIVSVALNLYLGWQLAGLELAITRRGQAPVEFPAPIATDILATIPTQTPLALPPAAETSAAETPDVEPPATALPSPLAAQVATLSALATEVAALRAEPPLSAATGTPPPTVAVPAAVAPPPDEPGATASPPAEPEAVADSASGTEAEAKTGPDTASAFSAPAEADPAKQAAGAAVDPTLVPYAELTSANSYELIPINGERDKRPAAEHGDLNLKLRDPQPIEVELGLVDVGSGVDADAPKLSAIFEPDFTAAYAVHDWDWGCNCKGDLIRDDQAILVGINTTPGEPLFIPPTERDIYDGKYHAVVLYASEDSLTFLYAREGTVALGYTVHYVGLRTDPNLLSLYQESEGSELPGLTLDTPVGTATTELLVAIRDNGKFLDARSINDWWD